MQDPVPKRATWAAEVATVSLQRFGFHTVAEIEGGSTLPTWWIMRREPR
jgi:hypothetical protein